MRLFIGIEFSSNIKQRIEKIQNDVRLFIKTAKFTDADNFHLTLSFIGETKRMLEVKDCMKAVACRHTPFHINICEFGFFQKGKGSILWVGSKKTPPLTALAKDLTNALIGAEFIVDTRSIVPHITLAREAVFKEKENLKFDDIVIPIENLTLFQSTRINGKLRYIPRYQIPIGKS